MSNKSHKGDTEKQIKKETPPDEEKAPENPRKKKKRKVTPSEQKQQKGFFFIWHCEVFWLTSLIKHISHYFFLFCPPADPSPTNDVNSLETSNVEEEENKLYQEYAAAHDHEGIHKYKYLWVFT